MIINNPELRKNIWMELERNRLILMPIILIVIYWYVFISSTTVAYSIYSTSKNLIFILGMIWGTKCVANAIVAEVNDRTWTFQRMLPYHPWQIAWAKLIAPAIIPWFGICLCLLVAIISLPNIPLSELIRHSLMSEFVSLIGLILGIILVHSICLFMFLTDIKSTHQKKRYSSTNYFIMSVAISPFFFKVPPGILPTTITWFNQEIDASLFAIISIILFLGHSLTGLYQAMRSEFQEKTTPLTWIVFLLITALYISGFTSNDAATNPVMFFISMCYISAFKSNNSSITLKKTLSLLKQGSWQELYQKTLPLWIYPLLFAFTLGMSSLSLTLLTYSLLFFRDFCIFFYFSSDTQKKRPLKYTFILLSILYLLLPFAFSLTDLKNIASLFLPIFDQAAIITFLSICTQITFLIWIQKKQYLKNEVP